MNYTACGPMDLFDPNPPNKKALEISFKLLTYHKGSNRTLTFHEYEQFRKFYWLTDIHKTPLYILENDDFSVLMRLNSKGDDLSSICNLRKLDNNNLDDNNSDDNDRLS